jgi:hypothetical protein
MNHFVPLTAGRIGDLGGGLKGRADKESIYSLTFNL